ncbi:hypothetical protein EZV62_025057 [Acer yangbiense]|uniref:DUF4283 domain-containing protein n=1 Tax=Acer yangbiense TaxID=1000413 RepID=A0A5C7GXZ0_9ROSI|nr:hypothetical protein EZV62_025057 [Acer yangbiense]
MGLGNVSEGREMQEGSRNGGWSGNGYEIVRLCGSMSLKERDGLVRTLKTNLTEVGLRRMAISLVGKVLSPKPVNRDVFRGVMRKFWQTREGVEIESVRDNIFTFQFGNMEDKRRIISGGPWSFNDALIVLEEPEGTRDFQRMVFNKAEF